MTATAFGGTPRQALKRLTGESLVYGLGQAGGRAVQLLLVPVLTRALSPQAYGVSELVIGYSQTALLVLVFGMDGALGRFFYEQPDRESRIRMVSSSLVFRVATGLAAALLLFAFSGPLAEQFMGGVAYRKYLVVGAATIPFTLLVMFANDVLRMTFQPWKYIALNVTQTVLTTVLALWLVLGRDLGVVGVLYGRLAGDLIAAALGLVLVRHSLAPRFSRALLRRMLGYGVPVVPAAFAFGWIAGVDRYVLQRTRSLEELAVYAVALKCFALVTVAASAFQLAYGPFAFARAASPDAPRLYARVLLGYVAVGAGGAMLVGLFAPEALALLVPPAYHGAAFPALWLAFAAVGIGAYTVSSLGIALALRTPLLGWAAWTAAAVATAAQWLLTPARGATGAAIATFLGYATAAAATWAIAQRVHPLPYRGGRIVALAALGLALAIAGQRLAPPGAVGVALKLALAGGYVATCVALRVWTERGGVR